MATQSPALTRDALAALPDSYFKAVDAKDVDAIVSHFAPEATLTVQTDHVTFTGADEIRRTGHVDGPVRAFEATPIVGESTRAAYLDAGAWLVKAHHPPGG